MPGPTHRRCRRTAGAALLLAGLLAGCDGDGPAATGLDPAPTSPQNVDETAAECTPKLDPTGMLGLPTVIRIGDELLETEILQRDPDIGSRQGSPLDELPPHITRLTEFGQRPEWHPDGTRLIFLDGPIGHVIELDLATGAQRELTAPFEATGHSVGYMRAHYLPSGDLFLCGPLERDPSIPDDGRFRGEMWVHRAPFDQPPMLLGQSCWEGLVVDEHSDAVAWTESDINFNDPDVFLQALIGRAEIHMGRIVYRNGLPELVDRRLVMTRQSAGLFGIDAVIEAQDFRHRSDGRTEIIFTAYFHLGGEVMGVDVDSGQVTNYSRAPLTYNEAKGIFPSGEATLVSRNLAFQFFPSDTEIWKLRLDGSGSFERMTRFTHYCGHGATNPTVAPDGRRFAFQMQRKMDGGPIGEGFGLLMFDLDLWEASR